MEYRFKHIEYNGLKGVIGEQLAWSFIRCKLAPKLVEEEKWTHVVFSRNDYRQHSGIWNMKLFKYDYFKKDFIVQGFYATMKLLSKYASAVSVLERNHCTPDGILLKLSDTGKTKRIRENKCPSIARLRIDDSLKHENSFELPIVEGDLEVVEVKCGRNAKLLDRQKKAYNDIIAKGIPLRMIRVRIVSFDLNRFLVEEHKYERFL